MPLLLPLLLATTDAAEETIDDPTASKPAVVAPVEKPSDLHVDVWSRTTVDTHWSRDPIAPALSEDVARSWLRTSFGVAGETASTLRYRLDVRLDLEARAKKGLARDTYLYDAVPLAAYVDVPIGEKLRVKVGEQIVAWGRMDLASAADVLDRRDLRAGPTVDPSWTRLPTPTVRADWHASKTFDFTLAWSVVSRPHRFEIAGSSWALLGPGLLGTVNGRDTLQRIAAATDASTFIRVQDAFVQASSAPPRIDGGDVAARSTAHLGGADLSFTYGYARTKLPVVVLHPALVELITVGNLPSVTSFAAALEGGERLIDTRYPRYHQFALDLEGNAGPFVLAWELGFSPRRPLYVNDPTGIPSARNTGLAQTGVRAQYTRGETFAVVAEADYFLATDNAPQGYFLLGPRRSLLVATLGVRDTLAKRHVLEGAAAMTSSGPSLLLSARYGYEVSDTFTVGLGGTFFPRLRGSRPGETTVADVQVGRDFVEVFVRARR